MRSAILAALFLSACGPAPGRAVAITFRGEVGGAPFECGTVYPGVGSTGTSFTAMDMRFYVHDVRVVTDTGEVPVALDDDGIWQDGDVALLDFETGGACDGGNAPTNFVVRGTVPTETGTIVGVRFVLGVPAERNHLDSASQPSPLNLSSLFWGWNGGYKFLRVEGRSTGMPGGVAFHLGATGCSGSAMAGTRVCTNANRPEIALDLPIGETVESSVVVADLADLFAAVDLDVDAGGIPGCLSDEDDPDCAAYFAGVGLGGTQTFFHVEPAP